MKAILHTKFGPPTELQIKEVDKPVPKDNEVLIKVHATTVTTTDCNVRNYTFVPKLFLLPAKLFMFGVFKSRINILGFDLAGEIEATGKDVTKFKAGDRVFGAVGIKFGAHAEYACVPEDGVLALKPDDMSWEEAAAVFLAGGTALFFIRDLGGIKAGQSILINGASGAIGTYAVQLAKYYGAEVTGVCSTANVDMVKSLGADKVIDYTKEDFPQSRETYDAIFDVVGKTSFSRCKNMIKKNGTYLVNLIETGELVRMILPFMAGGRKIKGGSAPEKVEDLNFLKELLEAGKLKPVIDRSYPLEQTAEAFKYVEAGHKKGNVVITVRKAGDGGKNVLCNPKEKAMCPESGHPLPHSTSFSEKSTAYFSTPWAHRPYLALFLLAKSVCEYPEETPWPPVTLSTKSGAVTTASTCCRITRKSTPISNPFTTTT